MDISEQKDKLRSELLEKRKAIPENEYHQACEEIIARLQTLDQLRSARTIHSYVSINSRKEVDTHGFLRWMLVSNKRVVVPVTKFETNELKNVELHSFENLSESKWGMLEPADGKEISNNRLDIVIVPMAGGDPDRNRIGYGKGFYDRFLSKVECPAIGLCFERCIVDKIPTGPLDVKLSAIVTEERIISG